MWIGTQAGLQRFDGTRFTNYLADIRDSTALQSDWVSFIFEDSKKRLWIGTDPAGAYVMDKQTKMFYNYNSHALAGNQINGIWNIAEDREGAIWIGGHDGFYRLNEITNQFERYNDKMGLDKKVRTGYITTDKDNNLWLATTDGVKLYDQHEKKLYGKNNNPLHNPLFDLKGNVVMILRNDDEVWLTIDRSIYRYDFSNNTLKTFSFDLLPSKKIGHEIQKELIGGVYRLRDGTIVAPLPNTGLAYYHPETDNFAILKAGNTRVNDYHMNEDVDENIRMFQDRDNDIWIGNGTGINIYNPEKQLFRTHRRDVTIADPFPNADVNDFLETDDGNLFIGYYSPSGGIVKMDSNFKFKEQYLVKKDGKNNNTSNQIWNLFKDEKGLIWAPNQNNSILKLNPANGHLTEEKDSLQNGPINTIRQDANNVIWMGCWRNGLAKMDPGSNKKTFYDQFLFSDPANLKRVQSILLDGDNIWVGTLQNGMQLFDKKKEKFTEAYLPSQKNTSSISSNCVTDIIKYNNDTLILATFTGVDIFDIRNKTFRSITAKEGLPGNLVQTLLNDKKGNIWIAGYDAWLCKLNMHDLSITNYDVTDGITDKVFTCKFHQLKNGRVLIGESGSFISFDPATLTASAPPADVRITGFRVFEKELSIDSLLNSSRPVTLSYKENSIRIEFASLQFWNPGSIKYYYKLDGVDKNWIVAGKDASTVYNHLKDGNYTFNVKCANRDGIFSKQVTQLKISISPPFWKTWWFISTAILCAVLFIVGLVKWREKNIKAVESEKLQLQQLNAEHYKSKLELEQIINYFSSSLINKHTVDDVLWDIAKNLIGRLGFVDCMIYLWNSDKTKMIQKAGFGPKDSAEEINKQLFTVLPGQGIVGHVMLSKEPEVLPDTSADSRYRPDDIVRLSEITVPILYNNELLGIIDSEHPEKNFYTQQHLQLLTTIATLAGNKIKSIEAEQLLQQTHIEIYSISEQLSKAKLEALRSQMNPHFIFNSLNAIQECILSNNVDAAYTYLSKFSKLQRMVLNNSQKELIPLSSEIEMLQLYLSLESLRFSKSFVYTINLAGITNSNEIMIPSLITQPLVENAIWHGLRNKEGDKELEMIYEEKNGKIYISIDDNGIGREEASAIKKQKLGNEQFASKGTVILQQRLQVLSQQLKADIRLETIDKKDTAGNAAGTRVVISFPSNLGTE